MVVARASMLLLCRWWWLHQLLLVLQTLGTVVADACADARCLACDETDRSVLVRLVWFPCPIASFSFIMAEFLEGLAAD